MDERQTQIKEGAGLEESRLNEDFLAFLNKWSFPVLLIIALVSGGYYVYNMLERSKITKRDNAFAQFGNVESAPNPSVISLTAIADEFEGVGSVTELALLQAGDIHLNAVRTGIDPSDGETPLTDEDKAFHLDQAESLYRRVADRVAGKADAGLFAVNAAFGLAATAESRGDIETARSRYTEAATLATKAGYAPLAVVANEMGASAGEDDGARLHAADELPRMPFEPDPATQSLDTTIDVLDDGLVGPDGPAAELAPDTDPAAESPADPTTAPAGDPPAEPAADPEDG
jgi:hypothetical protein